MSRITIIAVVCAGVGAAWVGAGVVLPAILRACLGVKAGSEAGKEWGGRVQQRYQKLGTGQWMFARFKLRHDPMFLELPELVKSAAAVRSILDIGCGYGVAGCAMLEWFGEARIYAMDPSAARVGVAASVFGERGRVVQAGAPEISAPAFPERFDLILLLDVIHYISDAQLALTLERIRDRMDAGGCLVMRAVIPPAGAGSLLWNLERIKRSITGAYACYRSVEQIGRAMAGAGLRVTCTKASGGNPESFWFVAQAMGA